MERDRTASMDKERIKGMAKQGEGSVKETAGKVMGDEKLKTEGQELHARSL